MAKRPTASDWTKDESIINAGVRGFNALDEIPRLLRKEIPWLNDFEFLFCSESDLPEMRSMDWRFLDTEMFDADEWNKATPLRFNMTSVDGHVKYRENWILIQHKDYRELIEKKRKQAADRQFINAVSTSGQASVQDPEYAKMKKYAEDLTNMETHRVQGTALSEPNREE